MSLALSPIRSYPNCFAQSVASVVFPVPGGPTNNIGFTPFIHFTNHSTVETLASSFPIRSSRFFGLYFSDHIMFITLEDWQKILTKDFLFVID